MMGPKASNFVRVDYPHTMDTLYALLEVLKDPKKYEKQLHALQEYMDKANATIEKLGKAEQIESLLTDAQLKHAQVDEMYNSAKSKAEELVMKASTEASTLLTQADREAKKIREDAQQFFSKAKENSKQLEADKNNYAQLLKNVTEREKEITKRENVLATIEKEIARKKELLLQL